MKVKLTSENLLTITKISTCMTVCWPPSIYDREFKILILDILCFLSFISSILLLIPLLSSIYQDWNDPLIMSKSVCLSCAVSQIGMKIAVCRIHRRQFQDVLFEMVTFLKEANSRQRKMMDFYLNKYLILHLVLSIGCHLTALAFICGPFLLSTTLPTDAKYPFSLNSSVVRGIIYIHQAIVAFQVSSAMTIDCLCATLLWFTATRFKLLSEDFQNVKNRDDIYQCIRQHQHLLRYARQLSSIIRFLIFATIFAATIGTVFAGVHLFTREPFTVKIQFVFIVCSAGALLFITAWPAEHVIETTTEIGNAVFKSNWTNKSSKLIKCWITVFQITQKPILVKIPGILPRLSLHYYFQFVSRVFSYLATVRILITAE